MKHAASHARIADPFNELVDSVDDLLKRLAGVESPDIRTIRAKVQVALAVAKSAWQDTTQYANQQVTNTLRWPGDYLRASPWKAIGIAALLGVGLGGLLYGSRGNGQRVA
jgi:ElaB/YqjD/DUF883 family membrane-anchored ribosome-binding protein